MTPFAIETHRLSRVYARSRKGPALCAVDGADLEVPRGEVMALLGPNGAGKTTMVRMLCCLIRPTGGTARVGGNDIRKAPEKVRSICGLSTEAPGLYERLTASEYLMFFARLYGVPDSNVSARVEEQLGAADLWGRRHDLLATFSKGMRQKINIARAVVHNPEVIFLDEPTSGLDVEAAAAVRERILDMSQRGETTFLICTHNLAEAERLCDRIAILRRGRVLATGTPHELRQRLVGERVLRVRLRKVLPLHREAAVSVPGVSGASIDADELVIHTNASQAETTPEIVRRLVESGADVIACVSDERSLEDVYLNLMRRDVEADGVGGSP